MLDIKPLSPDMRIIEEGAATPPSADVLARIDEIWSLRQEESDGTLFDGELFTLLTSDEQVLSGHFVPYRWYVGQLHDPDLQPALRIQPLAVSGLLHGQDGVVFGLRGDAVTTDRGAWELVPSGGIDPSSRDADGSISARAQLLVELQEETGLAGDAVSAMVPFALIADGDTHVQDIAVDVRIDCSAAVLADAFAGCPGDEYVRLECIPLDDLSAFLGRNVGGVVPVSITILQARQLIPNE